MPYCSGCNRSDLGDYWQWCPRCGSTLSAASPVPAAQPHANEMKEALIGFALNLAQNLVQHHLERNLSGAATVIDKLAGSMGIGTADNAGAAGSEGTGRSHAASEPEWYNAAVQNGQPELSATERALAEARRITQGRLAQQLGQAAITHMNNMTAITKQGLSR